jgi:hypothetical protein
MKMKMGNENQMKMFQTEEEESVLVENEAIFTGQNGFFDLTSIVK